MTPQDTLTAARAQLATLTAAVAPLSAQYDAAKQAQLSADSADATAQATKATADAAALVTAKARADADNAAASAKGKLAAAQQAVALAQTAVNAAIAAIPVDIDLALKSAKPGDTVAPSGQCESLAVTEDFKTPGVTLDLGDLPLTETPSPNASSNIVVHAPNFTVKRMNGVCGAVDFRVYAPGFSLLDSRLDKAISAILTGENGTDMHIARCVFGPNFQSCVVYVTTDRATVEYNKFLGSVGEYDLRFDVDSNRRTPVGALVQYNEFWNNANAFGKDAVGFRQIHGLRFLKNIVHGDVRMGQSPPAGYPPLTPVDCCRNAVLRGNVFDQTRPGGAAIRIYAGCTVLVDDHDFYGNALTDYISVQAGSEVVATNCRIHLPPGTTAHKPLIAASNTGKWTESGTTVLYDATPDRLYVAPAPQPTH